MSRETREGSFQPKVFYAAKIKKNTIYFLKLVYTVTISGLHRDEGELPWHEARVDSGEMEARGQDSFFVKFGRERKEQDNV